MRRTIRRLFGDPGVSYMLGGAYTLAALSFFTDHSVTKRTVVGQSVAPYDACWNVLYLFGGALIACAWVARSRQVDHEGFEIHDRLGTDLRWEAGALISLMGGFALNGITALTVQGMTDIRSYVFTVFFAASAIRLRRICGR